MPARHAAPGRPAPRHGPRRGKGPTGRPLAGVNDCSVRVTHTNPVPKPVSPIGRDVQEPTSLQTINDACAPLLAIPALRAARHVQTSHLPPPPKHARHDAASTAARFAPSAAAVCRHRWRLRQRAEILHFAASCVGRLAVPDWLLVRQHAAWFACRHHRPLYWLAGSRHVTTALSGTIDNTASRLNSRPTVSSHTATQPFALGAFLLQRLGCRCSNPTLHLLRHVTQPV